MRFDEQIFFDCQPREGDDLFACFHLGNSLVQNSLHDRFQLIGDFALRIIVGRIDHSISHDENLSFRFTMSVALPRFCYQQSLPSARPTERACDF